METNAKGYTMGSFKFYCPHCEQKIEADESMRGEIANCPCCNEEIVVDELSSWKEICKTCDGAGTMVPKKQEKRNRTVKNKKTQTPKWQAGNSDFDSSIVKGGCGFILGLILLCAIVDSCDDKNDRKTTANSGIPTEEELMYPMDGKDPKNWRKHEEDLENRLPHLKNAPYACKRCGMKSDRPLDDPQGVWGRNGVCAYCIDYLHSKR